ncbi:hypothetical protein HND78_08790 [Neisseria meningitidis]|nr:hypothetical protein [Neisseria meningitidis]
MKPRNLFFAGCLLTSATFAEDIGVPVELINVGNRIAMPSEVPKSAAGGDVRGDRMGMPINIG